MLNHAPPPVLIVSRDATLSHRLARAFEPACTPYPAPSRAAALEWLDTNTPRGVVIDLDTPAGERIDLLREVRRRHPTVPCLALATSLTPDLVDDVENLGAEVGSTGSAKIAVSRFAREVAVLLHTRDDRVARCVSALAQARGLTLRQTEIVTLAVERVGRDGIQRRLGITVHTLKTLTRSLLDKTGGSSLGDVAWNVQVRCGDHSDPDHPPANLWQPTERKAWP